MPCKFPFGGEQLHSLRKGGRRPAETVLVSLGGRILEANATVVLLPEQTPRELDWRFLVDLDVVVLLDKSCPFERNWSAIEAVDAVSPRHLSAIFYPEAIGGELRDGVVRMWRPWNRVDRAAWGEEFRKGGEMFGWSCDVDKSIPEEDLCVAGEFALFTSPSRTEMLPADRYEPFIKRRLMAMRGLCR